MALYKHGKEECALIVELLEKNKSISEFNCLYADR